MTYVEAAKILNIRSSTFKKRLRYRKKGVAVITSDHDELNLENVRPVVLTSEMLARPGLPSRHGDYRPATGTIVPLKGNS